MAQVELAQVEKRFGDVQVVKGVSVSIDAGEFLVLVGPSGCGKSTCLRMIAGLETVSAGEVRIGGRVVNDMAPKDRNIGMVFQSYALYPHMTVRDNLGFGLSLRKVARSAIDERIREAAESLDLVDLLDRRPRQLSGGQRQRVAIGRAIVKQPDVFLFDEPLSNLDAALRVQMRTELAELHQRLGTTMVYVTHDQVEAMMLADRIAVMNGGVLQQVGAPLELYRRPTNRFVAGFIGSPSMNFIPGRLVESDGGIAVEAAGATIPLLGFDAGRGKDRPVELGVRPQDVIFGEGDIRGRVTLVEQLGWEAFVHVEVAPGEPGVRARVEGPVGGALAIGETVSLRVDPRTAHVFSDSGDSIWCGDAVHGDAN